MLVLIIFILIKHSIRQWSYALRGIMSIMSNVSHIMGPCQCEFLAPLLMYNETSPAKTLIR